MQDDRFEWDDAKARANLKKHDVSFEVARRVFDDPAAIDERDDSDAQREDRSVIIGMVAGGLLTVVYTEREDCLRIISARKATRREQVRYFSQSF